jgi:hypothetical protein
VKQLSVLPFTKAQESWKPEGKGIDAELRGQLEHSFNAELVRAL